MLAVADTDLLIKFVFECDTVKDFLIVSPVPFTVTDHEPWMERFNF